MHAHFVRAVMALMVAAVLGAVSAPAGADTFEPNNSTAQAAGPLVSNTAYVSFIGTPGDVDYYYVDADLGDFAAELVVPFNFNLDYDLYIVDEQDNIFRSSDNEAGFDEFIQSAVTGSGRFFIKVVAFEGFSDSEPYQITVAYNPLNTNTPPSVQVTSPNGGETLSQGTTHTITWTASDTEDGSNLAIAIDYSTNGGGSWTSITASTTNTGSFPWTVPAVTTTQGLVRVRATDSGAITSTDQSNANFTIQVLQNQPPTVSVLAPNGGETWTAGSVRSVQWTASDPEDGTSLAIAIDYSTNGGSSWTPITASTTNSGSFAWTVPGTTTTQGRVRVTATDSGAIATTDQSNANFTIDASVPLGTATLSVGSGLQVNAGQTVSVPITVQHDRVLAGMQVTITYDAFLLTAQSVAKESRAAPMTLGSNLSRTGEAIITLTQASGTGIAAGSGPVASVSFLARAGGAATLTAGDAVVSDDLGRAMTLTLNHGSVTVIGVDPDLALSIPASLGSSPGSAFDVPVTFTGNLGVSALQFALQFDPAVLTPLSVTQGGRTTGMTLQQNLSVPGEVRTVFFFPGGGVLSEGTGVACTIRFTTKTTAPGNTALTFADVVCADANGGNLPVATQSGQVTGVRLSSFTAGPEPGEGVRLSWTAASDEAHAGFRVLRGEPSPLPLHAGLLPPTARDYVDGEAEPGQPLVYWLEAVDRDGAVQRFGPAAVTLPVRGLLAGRPYPNPLLSGTRLEVAGLEAGATATVVDMTGRRVRSLDVPAGARGLVTWDGRDDEGRPTPAGVYLIHIVSGSERISRRLIKTGS